MSTPLTPQIEVADAPASLGVCNCCGTEKTDGSVKHVRFHWRDGKKLGGGTAVALCRKCRVTTIKVLFDSLMNDL